MPAIKIIFILLALTGQYVAPQWARAGENRFSHSRPEVQFSIYRHDGLFNHCEEKLLSNEQARGTHAAPHRHDVLLPTQHSRPSTTPVDRLQSQYFSEMIRRETLTPQEVSYYSQLTYELNPDAVSFVASTRAAAQDSTLMVVNGFDGHQLPFERQFQDESTAFVVDRNSTPHVFEIGRAKGGELFSQNIAVAALVMASDVYSALKTQALQQNPANTTPWIALEQALKNAKVFVHATTELHLKLYTSPRYQLTLEHTVQNQGKNEYILSISLFDLIQKFSAEGFLNAVSPLGTLGLEAYLNVRALTAAQYLDYTNSGHPGEPHVVSIYHRTQQHKEKLDQLFRQHLSKTYEQIAELHPIQGAVERDMLQPSIDEGLADLLGTSNFIYVDGLRHSSLHSKEALGQFLRALYENIRKNYAHLSPAEFTEHMDQTILLIPSTDDIASMSYVHYGLRSMRNNVSLKRLFEIWPRYRRMQWMGGDNGEINGLMNIFCSMGFYEPGAFYDTAYNVPGMYYSVRAVHLADLEKLLPQDGTHVLYRGARATLMERNRELF